MKHFLWSVLILTVPAWAQNPVTVRVVDAQNAPVAGAQIEVRVWLEQHKAIPSQITGADGAATFDIPSVNGKMAFGGVSVVAKGFAFNNAALKTEGVEVHLERGAAWRGQVFDDAGKPIEGAEVSVNGARLGQNRDKILRLYGEKNSASYRIKTGADGCFEIGDVPDKMSLQYKVEHPDYVFLSGFGALPNAEAKLKLVPGGAAHGRVLDLAGKPIADANVYASLPSHGGGNDGKTDANGNFTIRSLAAGIYSIGVYDVTVLGHADFVFPRVADVRVEVGKTSEAPDVRAVKGAEIQGIVRDALTKKPIAGANMYAETEDDTSASAQSDAAGYFSLRVVPGRYKVYISGAPKGYVRPNEQKTVVASEAAANQATKNEANLFFDLKKTVVLRGTLVDEVGKPLQAKLKIGYDSFIESDAKGKWKYEPQDERALQLAGGDAEDGYFEVVSPLSIEAGTELETTIVLRKKPWQVLPGRTLTVDGKPLEGVQIDGQFSVEMGDGNGPLSTSERSATSNANGDFVLPKIRDGIQANSNFFTLTGKKEGYAFQKGGALSKNGPVWQVSDLIFIPMNAKIEGVTSPGARVTAAGIEVVAGADGKFAVEGLPATANQVFAFKDGLFGDAKGASPLQIELKPQTAQARDENLAREVWSDIVREAERDIQGKSYSRLNEVKRRTEAGAKTFADEAKAATGDRAIFGLVERWNGQTDTDALEAAISRITDVDMRAYIYLSAARKSNDKDFLARALQEVENGFKTPETSKWSREINLYQAAVVTAKLQGEKAGFAALDRALAFTLKNHGEKSTRQNGMPGQTGRDEMMALSAEILADGGAALLRRLVENIEAGDGYDAMALGTAIPVLAKTDLESALSLLDELEKMPEPGKSEERQRADQSPSWAFSSAAMKVVPLLGQKSPEKALQLARRVRDENYGSEMKWQALAGAATFQSGESAAKLWREVVTGAGAQAAPRYAARAWEFDLKLGHELFEIARQKTEVEGKNEWQSREIWGSFAFYSARDNAAQARFLLEREWGIATQKKIEENELGTLAFAMSAIDARRAMEMAREIPTDNFFASFDTRRKIGLYLVADETKRRNFPFSRNSNYEEWRAIDAE